MTTKRNPKIEQYRNLEMFFMKLYGRGNQSKRTTKHGKTIESSQAIETSSK